MHYISASEQVLALARRHLLEFGHCQPGLLQSALAQSWERSFFAGINPAHGPEKICHGALRDVIEQNHDFLAFAQPVMDSVSEQIKHSNSMMVLADKSCTLIHTVGDKTFLDKAAQVALSEGANWQETCVGTNAVGLALTEQGPVQVQGSEHFLERNGFLHCAATPIFSAQGQVAGILDISSDKNQQNSHSLGLARMAARMIENAWISATHPQHLKLFLHTDAKGLGSLTAALLLVSSNGIVDGGNQEAMRLFGLRSFDFGKRSLASLLQMLPSDWVGQLVQADQAVTAVQLVHGGRLYVRVKMPSDRGGEGAQTAQASHFSKTRAARAPRAAAAFGTIADVGCVGEAASADALAAFDLGDTRWHMATQKARRVMDKSIALLVQGESGSGKEQFSRAAHASSARADKPFVAINCAAIPESLIESELFGYAPGAFSGARKEGSLGRLREAHGGTLFLDEIGDMPLALQARLLRVLQDRVVTPLGAGQSVVVDFSLICATHRNLLEAVERGDFRADLYYRINGLTVMLPALRDREDFGALTAQLLLKLQKEQGQPSERSIAIDADLLAAMQRFEWPGNVRQLHSVLRTACAMLDENECTIEWQHLADDIALALQATQEAGGRAAMVHALPYSVTTEPVEHCASDTVSGHFNTVASTLAQRAAQILPSTLQTLSQQAIATALRRTGGNISRAAKELGISRQTLHRRLNEQKFAMQGPA